MTWLSIREIQIASVYIRKDCSLSPNSQYRLRYVFLCQRLFHFYSCLSAVQTEASWVSITKAMLSPKKKPTPTPCYAMPIAILHPKGRDSHEYPYAKDHPKRRQEQTREEKPIEKRRAKSKYEKSYRRRRIVSYWIIRR